MITTTAPTAGDPPCTCGAPVGQKHSPWCDSVQPRARHDHRQA